MFYIDEDTKGIVATEIYDGRGQFWRVQELGGGVQYELPLCGGSGDTVYDLMVGRYLMLGLINEEKPIDFDAQHLDASRYTPGNIRRLGRYLTILGKKWRAKVLLARFCRLPFDA